jgi:uncharacterized GH25 family protein
MKQFVRVIVIAAALACAMTSHAQFGRGLGIIEGTVVDSNNKPVSNATVTIQTSDGLQPHATHTDSSGHFEFTRFESGQYDLRAYSSGLFSEWTKRAVVKPKKATEITLRLRSRAN